MDDFLPINYPVGAIYKALAPRLESKTNEMQDKNFYDMVNQFSGKQTDILDIGTIQKSHISDPKAYKKYLEQRFGPVTLQDVPKDQKSLDAMGARMNGRDIVIAPNIFDKMVKDPEKAAYYEEKISYFFTDVIPKGEAYAKSVGLTFEPCGVVVHSDGTVTYICGGGDPPEKVAKVAAENRAKMKKKAQKLREYMECAAKSAAQLRVIWEDFIQKDAMEKSLSATDDWLKIRRLIPPSADFHSEPVPQADSANFFYHYIPQ
ncbi:hypothetical protein D7Y09_02625 [bacterium 1XD42-1]|nr:hypothetical protein [Oscillospiraceae bacterium]RKJ58173.1 hypothetical protein D7X25_02085 [bacterium 1XD42-8]RKJ66996.1 hypothetical protein D7Y09_02625 [bacterium 1XD42-1]